MVERRVCIVKLVCIVQQSLCESHSCLCGLQIRPRILGRCVMPMQLICSCGGADAELCSRPVGGRIRFGCSGSQVSQGVVQGMEGVMTGLKHSC